MNDPRHQQMNKTKITIACPGSESQVGNALLPAFYRLFHWAKSLTMG